MNQAILRNDETIISSISVTDIFFDVYLGKWNYRAIPKVKTWSYFLTIPKGETKLLIEKIKQGKRVQHYETLRMKNDGTIINVSITLSPVFDASGKLVAISTIARDNTENKKAEEALRLLNLYNRSLIEASLDPVLLQKI